MCAGWAKIWIFSHFQVNGNAPKEDVFSEIDSALSSVLDKKSKLNSAPMATGMAS